jgi:heme oxygenase (biliverdin-IX-beta and delta-forming)
MQALDNSTPSILQRLKSSTAAVHERVEKRLQIFSPEFDLAAYRSLLARFYGFWAPLERELCGVSELNHVDLDLGSRLKAHLLKADLQYLNTDLTAVPECRRLPDVRTFARGLGCLYVLEGSTLGAQFIARHLRERFDITAGNGGSFFNAYGAGVPKRWAEFRGFLMLHAPFVPHDDVLTAAGETFGALDEWLALQPMRADLD